MQNKAIETIAKNKNYPGTKSIFKPSSWLNQMDAINRIIQFNNKIILILADQGAGKTTFGHLLQTHFESQFKIYFIKAIETVSQNGLLRQLDIAFQFFHGSEIKLSGLIKQINEQKTPVLMIIDDAHYLQDSFLKEALSGIKNQGIQGFFHLCLLSDFSISSSLDQLDRDLLHILELGTLKESETKTYLSEFLPKKIEEKITEKDFKQFYQITNGSIARINKLIRDFDSESMQFTQKRNQKRKMRVKVRNLGFLVVTVAIALLGSFYVWQNQFLSSPTYSAEVEHNSPPQLMVESSQSLPFLIPTIPFFEKKIVLISQLPDINQELANQPSQIPSWFVSAIRQQVQVSLKKPETDIALGELSDEKNNEKKIDDLVVNDRKERVVVPKILQTQKPQIKTRAIQETEIIIPKISSQNSSLENKQREKQAKAKLFTIQILATRNQDDLIRFMKSHKIKKDVKIRQTTRDGLNWYVLTVGEYEQMEYAQVAVKHLPPELAQYNPWIRRITQLKSVS